MELFILLVLSFCCCQAGSPEGREVDCDDPKVFKAVDLALRAYNDRREGNQFALVQVLEARETEGPGTNLLVTYRLKETSCAVGRGHWQECGYTAEADSGRCVAKVHYINHHDSTVSQTCTILRAPEKVFTSIVTCLGCWYPIANDNPALLPIVRYIVQQFNNQSEYPSYFDVGEIANSQRQVVSGWKYQFDYTLRETNCSKAEFAELKPACRPIPGGRTGYCGVIAFVNISDTLVYASQDCIYKDVATLSCVGCPQQIVITDPDMLKALDVALEKYNNESSDIFFYKVRQISAAMSQLVAGVNYRVDFTIIRTNCSKDRVPKLNKICTSILPTKLMDCRATIYVKPWESLIFPQVTCTKIMKDPGVQRSIAGLTPFRKSRQTVTLPGVFPESKRRARRGHGYGHKHGHKHGHKKRRSSEEFHDDATNQEEALLVAGTDIADQPSTSKLILQEDGPSINPTSDPAGFPDLPIPDSAGGSPDGPLFDPLPDLPAPPASMCPGKLWQPLTVPTTPAPTHPPFEDFDLLDALY